MPWFHRSETPMKAVNWKTNLVALWVSQFFSLAAFSFCLPFLPNYLKISGIVPEEVAGYWAGVLQSVSSVSMMVVSPMWGMLGDRYGRKMMLVRANLAGAFVLYLMALIHNIEGLVVLRLLHGCFTGTIAAAQTLVATNTPDRNQGFAIGLIMAAVNAGQIAGRYFGGKCAEYFSPEICFKIGGWMLFFATLMVVFMVKEHFIRPEQLPTPSQSARLRRRRDSISSFKSGLPILGTIVLVSFLQVFDNPYFPLYIGSLHHASASATGLDADTIGKQVFGIVGEVSAVTALAAMAGSVAAGIVMDRKLPGLFWALIPALGAVGVGYIVVEPSLFGLVVGQSLFFFITSGLASAVIVVMGRMTPSGRRGAAMGWSQTARSVGWSCSPVLGALTAQYYGWSAAYSILAILTALLIPAFIFLHRRYNQAFQPMDEDPPSMGPVGGGELTTPTGQGRV